MRVLLPLHIMAGGLALLFGATAIVARKGAFLHRRAGIWFVAAMLVMALTGAVMAALQRTEASVVAGLLTTYLVLTAVLTVRAHPPGVATVLMTGALLLGLTSIGWGLDAMLRGEGSTDGIPAPIFFVFGTVALLGGVGDLRLMRAGGLHGGRRLARHLWRMCFALWIASASFFLGQADEFPAALRIMPLLFTLAFLPLAVMLYWLGRVRLSRVPVRPAAG